MSVKVWNNYLKTVILPLLPQYVQLAFLFRHFWDYIDLQWSL